MLATLDKPADLHPGYWTQREIAQQPAMLRATQALLVADAAGLEHFLAPLLARPELRIVLAGAGTSSFIGQCLAPALGAHLGRAVEAVATTDIVATPRQSLDPGRPTLLLSFGRSGNSPESLAAIELADQLVRDVHHLVFTCNGAGALDAYARHSARAHLVLLPEATHDRSFAMTSSFTAMMYAAWATLTGIAPTGERVDAVADALQQVLDGAGAMIGSLAERRFGRVVYLGAGCFKGLACEAALKMLEITDGEVVTLHDTPLGFRHGPKVILNADTLVVLFLSNDLHTRAYDLDLLAELRAAPAIGGILAVTARPIDGPLPQQQMVMSGLAHAADVELLFPYVAVAQLLAFHQSLALGKSPDAPNPSGIVNRVVTGVRIHALV